MKGATSTLHKQLSLQTGIFMSTPKEPNYFSDDAEYERGEQWYNALFDRAEVNDLCGESSTHYTKLPDYPLTVERMAKKLKSPKFIYVMRHPVDRLISHYIHQWSQNVIKYGINEAIDSYKELTSYSCYAKQLEPYFNRFGQENILPIFTEAIRRNPQEQLDKVTKFIGYQGRAIWEEDVTSQNISGNRIRAFKGYRWLVESDLMTFIRRSMIPKSIRNKVKQRLTMQKRPEIDEIHLSKLTTVFDQDLFRLGRCFGVELSCENYTQVVCSQNLFWQQGLGGK